MCTIHCNVLDFSQLLNITTHALYLMQYLFSIYSLQEIQTIATCEMKTEDNIAQSKFWRCINEVMEKKGFAPPDFAGFMADEAQANWIAVRNVYNNGEVIEGRERTCHFHWEQSLVHHNRKFVKDAYQVQHKHMCELWREARTKKMAQIEELKIRRLWRNGAVDETHIASLDSWLSWWGMRLGHWGGLQVIDNEVDDVLKPTVNLSESKHGSWKAGEGGRKNISLYDACATDLFNAILQSARDQAFKEGKYKGTGPSYQKLQERLNQKGTPRPAQILHMVREATTGTPMYQQPSTLEGDKQTIRKKRKNSNRATIDVNASHRPEYNMETITRRQGGRARQINFDTDDGMQTNVQDVMVEEVKEVIESDVHPTLWAIRRTNVGSKVKCLAFIKGQNRNSVCHKPIPGSSNGVPAPCFFAERAHKNGVTAQFAYFCPTDSCHTWTPDHSLKPWPPRPAVWPVARGTNLTKEEVKKLQQGGYMVEEKLKECGTIGTPLDDVNVEIHAERSQRTGPRWRYRTTISNAAKQKIEMAMTLNPKDVKEEVIMAGLMENFYFVTRNDVKYTVCIKDEPCCSCPDFQDRVEGQKSFLACKHMYHVYVCIIGLDIHENMFIHQPFLTSRDLTYALTKPRSYF